MSNFPEYKVKSYCLDCARNADEYARIKRELETVRQERSNAIDSMLPLADRAKDLEELLSAAMKRLEAAEKALRQLVDAYYNTESIEKFESLVQRADEIVREEK